jgi:hypothetical protein
MAELQRLKLTLHNQVTDRTWTDQPLEVTADPDDYAGLMEYLDQMARDLDGRWAHGWRHEYRMRIQGVEQHWVDRWIAGQN